MIDIGRRAESGRGVARFAHVRGADVGGGLTRGRCSVMATKTVSRNAGVGEHGVCKRGGRMASVALRCGGNVVGRLADRYRSVVATAARSGDFLVIDSRGRRKSRGAVASFALVRRGDVGRRFADRRGAVVTARAVGRNAGMVETCIGERGGVVTGITLRGGGDMGRGFADGDGAVVATAARPYNLCVIHAHRRLKCARVVAGFTCVRRRDMRGAFAHGR